MAEENKTDTELREMTEEQLEALINAKPEETTEESSVADETVEEEKEGTSEETETQDETVAEPITEDEVDDPYFRGKTKKEMYEIIKQNNAMISRQSNKEHEIMKRLEQLEQLKNKVEEKKAEDELYFVDESGKKVPYDKRDIEVIEKLVDRKLEYSSRAKREQEVKQKADNVQDNEQAWADLSIYNPSLKAEIQEKVLAEIQRDKASTLESKGWLKTFIATTSKQKQITPVSTLDKSKKLKATTVTSG